MIWKAKHGDISNAWLSHCCLLHWLLQIFCTYRYTPAGVIYCILFHHTSELVMYTNAPVFVFTIYGTIPFLYNMPNFLPRPIKCLLKYMNGWKHSEPFQRRINSVNMQTHTQWYLIGWTENSQLAGVRTHILTLRLKGCQT